MDSIKQKIIGIIGVLVTLVLGFLLIFFIGWALAFSPIFNREPYEFLIIPINTLMITGISYISYIILKRTFNKRVAYWCIGIFLVLLIIIWGMDSLMEALV